MWIRILRLRIDCSWVACSTPNTSFHSTPKTAAKLHGFTRALHRRRLTRTTSTRPKRGIRTLLIARSLDAAVTFTLRGRTVITTTRSFCWMAVWCQLPTTLSLNLQSEGGGSLCRLCCCHLFRQNFCVRRWAFASFCAGALQTGRFQAAPDAKKPCLYKIIVNARQIRNTEADFFCQVARVVVCCSTVVCLRCLFESLVWFFSPFPKFVGNAFLWHQNVRIIRIWMPSFFRYCFINLFWMNSKHRTWDWDRGKYFSVLSALECTIKGQHLNLPHCLHSLSPPLSLSIPFEFESVYRLVFESHLGRGNYQTHWGQEGAEFY